MNLSKLPDAIKAYYRRVGAEVVNYRSAIIKDWHGVYYRERARIHIARDGEVICRAKEYAPTKEEAEAIKLAAVNVDFPKTITARNTDALKPQTSGDLYEFWDRASGEISFVQERRIIKGRKAYIPWVFMSDGEWMRMEPDNGLPFWKPRNGSPGARIMIHEGAKSAHKATEIITTQADHPWLEELSLFEHWGMVGGALAPHRTDFRELTNAAPSEVIYVCDNDNPGKSALQEVSRHWHGKLKGIYFDDKFPDSWDIADPMPKSLFSRSNVFTGNPLLSYSMPATFATETIKQEKGRPLTLIRADFTEEWLHCVTPEVFVHRDWPNEVLSTREFNNKVRPFSDVDDTARILMTRNASKNAKLCYDPSAPLGVFTGDDGVSNINTFRPSPIKPIKGDATPWEEFITYLIPGEEDRNHLIRWIATLVCKPEMKMFYSVLLISETQGVGKGTLGEKVIAPLIGKHNVSVPSEADVVDSSYNDWIVHKRLAIIHEIYAGHSSKAYDKLKAIITDRDLNVSKKYVQSYTIQNWIHLFACSNSRRAIRPSMDDRRWFFPQLTERKSKSRAYWQSFNEWLTEDNGLAIILDWLHTWIAKNGAVQPGEEAPNSALKRSIQDEGMSPGQRLIVERLELIAAKLAPNADFITTDAALVNLIRQEMHNNNFSDKLERAATIRKIVKTTPGWFVGDTPARITEWGAANWKAHIIANKPELVAVLPTELAQRSLRPVETFL